MVKSEKLYSPQNYLELITGEYYTMNTDDDVACVENILEEEGYCLWSYPLSEIEHIVENELDVVLVDCMIYNEEINEFEHEYRWFEVPEDESNKDRDTKEAFKMLNEAYIMGRETGHPLYSDDWKYIKQDLEGLNYYKEIVKARFEELCNM